MPKTSLYIRRITVSAVFLSIALVLKTVFSFYIPLFGQNGMRIDASVIFSITPSILFGPVYGAIVSGLTDLLGFFLKPTGPYLPQMTLIMAAGGFIRGALWLAFRGRSSRNMRICVAVISVLLLIFGLCNIVFLNADGVNAHFYDSIDIQHIDTGNMHLISGMLVSRTIGAKDPAGSLSAYIVVMTAGLVGIAAFGIILLIADIFVSNRFFKNARKGNIMQLLLSMMISGLIVTTLDTVLLRETIYMSWKVLPFAAVWIPRVIQEVLSGTIYSYFVALLLGLFENQLKLRGLVK